MHNLSDEDPDCGFNSWHEFWQRWQVRLVWVMLYRVLFISFEETSVRAVALSYFEMPLGWFRFGVWGGGEDTVFAIPSTQGCLWSLWVFHCLSCSPRDKPHLSTFSANLYLRLRYLSFHKGVALLTACLLAEFWWESLFWDVTFLFNTFQKSV